MKIIVDADGCPVLGNIIELGLKHNLEIFVVADTSHIFEFDNKNIKHIIADKGADSSDFIIIKLANKGDIVVTQDYGLASMCLAREIFSIHQNGMIYSNDNIDELMYRRHLGKKLRKSGKYLSKSKKRVSRDNNNFGQKFKELIQNNI